MKNLIYVARVDRQSFIVKNIESADPEWISENNSGPDLLVPFSADNPAIVGLSYDPSAGLFEQITKDTKPEDFDFPFVDSL